MDKKSTLSPVVSNIYMEPFAETALDMVKYKSSLWLCFVNDASVVWSQGITKLCDFHMLISSLRLSIQFITEVKMSNMIPFQTVLSARKDIY